MRSALIMNEGMGGPAREPRLSNFYIDEVDIRKTILAPVPSQAQEVLHGGFSLSII